MNNISGFIKNYTLLIYMIDGRKLKLLINELEPDTNGT